MSITITLPAALQTYAGGSSDILLDGPANVGEALCTLAGMHPGVIDRVMDERGLVRQHVNVFVDGDEIRYLDGIRTPLREGSSIVIVPAVSGG